jgi:glycosyltransferase involved in cell wall biosynthesis
MQNKQMNIYIFSHNVEPNGISGGETILIETFRRIGKYFSSVTVYTWKPGRDLYKKYGLTDVKYILSQLPVIPNFYASFLLRTLYGIRLGFSLRLKHPEKSYLYFSSDFWPDAIPVMLLKMRYPKSKFLSNFYLAAPNPFIGFNEKGKVKMPSLNGIFFWLMQKPVYYFSKYFADFVFVTSIPDIDRFPKQKKSGRYFIVKGGVNVGNIKKFQKHEAKKDTKKIYDGVFMGRFHPQKGPVELLSIWKKVMKKLPHAQLIMIGDGPLMPQIKRKLHSLTLEKNVILTGYIFDSDKRYRIFNQSKIALHPAVYDSGGMAVAEAMAFGLPGISFDLKALKTYYPKGMIKIPQGNISAFANTIVTLLQDKSLYKKTQIDALDLVESEWNWDKRAKDVYKKIQTV